jgi:hypothetical protein
MIGRASGLHNPQLALSPDKPLSLRTQKLDGFETVEKELEGNHAQPIPGEPSAEHEASPSAHEPPPPAKPSTCEVCQENFSSGKQLRQHTLWSDRCGIRESVYKRRYFCRRCFLRFATVEDARRHFNSDRICQNQMYEFRYDLDKDIPPLSHLQRIQETVKAATRRYDWMTLALSEAAKSLDDMSSPKIRAIPGRIEHLLAIKEGRGLHSQNLTTTKIASVTPLSRSKGSSKTTKNANVPSRTHLALKQQHPSKDQITPSAVDRVQPKRSTTRPANEPMLNPVSGQKELVRRVPSLRSDDEQKDWDTITSEQLAQENPDIALASKPNADLVLQVQHLTEQVRLLTERLLSPTAPVESPRPKQASAATISLTAAHDVPGVPGAESSEMSQALSVSQPVDDSAISRKRERLSSVEINDHPRFPAQDGQKNRSTEAPQKRHDTSSSELPQPPGAQDVSNTGRPTMYTSTKEGKKLSRRTGEPAEAIFESMMQATAADNVPLDLTKLYENKSENQRLTRQIHTQARLMKSSDHSNKGHADSHFKEATTQAVTPSTPSSVVPATSSPGEMSEQSLLDELFPESSSYTQPHYTGRNPYPKLDLPSSVPLVRRAFHDQPLSEREKMAQSFQKSSENITALQLVHCSTELVEADFRRLVPKGKHIEGWTRDGEFTKVIPGRDPINLERLPFYYLLFKSPASALAYQKNAGRLHKLSQLHQPSSIMSPIPPPKGFLEDGEDINLATASYLLKPPGVPLGLHMVMQPYNASLRALIEQGGYRPIAPFTSASGKPIYKVLMHIEGYEPSQMDLYQLLAQEGYSRGIQWPFHNEHAGIHRLRDIGDLRARLLPVSSANPRAANVDRHRSTEDDPSLSFLKLSSEEGGNAAQINQMVMNRVYNRWIIEFDEEEAARRFARLWNRRVLPVSRSVKHVTWRDTEERRMCNTEYLW